MKQKQQMLRERVELLGIAEELKYPRLAFRGNGRVWAVRAGKPSWEKFCAVGHTTRVITALRNARILRDNGVVPYNPREEVAAEPTLEVNTSGMVEQVTNPLANATGSLLDEIAPRREWIQPETAKVYPPGKRRKYPTRKNRAKE